MSSVAKPRTLLSIELTRGLAAFAILVYHLVQLYQQHYGTGDLTVFYPVLSCGVDVFFFISGFLMVYTTQRPVSRQPASFLLKRWIRIFPAYWLVVLPLIGLYYLQPYWFPTLTASHASLMNTLLLLPNDRPLFLITAWTLVFEMYFYLLFAATLWLLPVKQISVLACVFIISVAYGLFYHPSQSILAVSCSPLLLEFTAGMLAAFFWPRVPRPHPAWIVLLILSALIWFMVQPMLGQTGQRFLTSGIPALLLMLAILGMERRGFPPVLTKPALLAGGLSYALYLVHMPIIGASLLFIKVTHVAMPFPVLAISVVISSLAAAVLIHYTVEIPLQKRLYTYLGLHTKTPQMALEK